MENDTTEVTVTGAFNNGWNAYTLDQPYAPNETAMAASDDYKRGWRSAMAAHFESNYNVDRMV